MLRLMLNGFCMALADSVPGVSGGTVAFILGFYDRFIGSIQDLAFGSRRRKKRALRFLVRLGIGWVIGMILAVLILSSLFQSHIYGISSLFIGFIAGAIPLIFSEEKESVSQVRKGIVFLIVGVALVVLITRLNGGGGSSVMTFSHFTAGAGIRLFLIGIVAISAMFLPGISGSTLLLIFGAYIPVISALKDTLTGDLSKMPFLLCLILGILVGAFSVARLIKIALEKFRPQMIYFILGMMIGSFYAIVMGPTTLEPAMPALSIRTFRIIPCIIGVALIFLLQYVRVRSDRKKASVRRERADRKQ